MALIGVRRVFIASRVLRNTEGVCNNLVVFHHLYMRRTFHCYWCFFPQIVSDYSWHRLCSRFIYCYLCDFEPKNKFILPNLVMHNNTSRCGWQSDLFNTQFLQFIVKILRFNTFGILWDVVDSLNQQKLWEN